VIQINLLPRSFKIMNTIAKVLVSFVVVATPALSFAQTQDAPLTRAQVKAELAELERAGYSAASGDDANYPANLQAAEAKVAAQHNMNQTNEAYGGTHSGGVASGSGSMQRNAWSSSKDANKACVGPVSFCTPFFGS
jgi:hypothetical protein